jgi:hypothetical protein
MSRIFVALAVLSLSLGSFGCVSHTITQFEDNPKAPLTALEVDKRFSVWTFYSKNTHQFYMCQDTGSQLVCKLSCDGNNDAACPATSNNGIRTTTNVR